MTLKDVESILYFESFVVTSPGMTSLEYGQVLSEELYCEYTEKYGDEFEADIGAEAIKKMLSKINLKKESEKIKIEIPKISSETIIKKLSKRLRLIESFMYSKNNPDWMILSVLPVLPPDLRPLVPLDGG